MKNLTIKLIIAAIILLIPHQSFSNDVYNLGKLEVNGEDLSSVNFKGSTKELTPVNNNNGGKRLSRRLLNLGDSSIVLDNKKGSFSEVEASIGTYTTVKLHALASNIESRILNFDYKSSDGYRFKTDYLKGYFKIDSLQNKFGDLNGDLGTKLSYDRRNMPGTIGNETQFLERKISGIELEGLFHPENSISHKLSFRAQGLDFKGNSTNLNINDESKIGEIGFDYEFIPEKYRNIQAGISFLNSTMNLNQGNNGSMSDILFKIRGEKEFLENNLVSTTLGLKKISAENIQPEIDITLRKKSSQNGDMKFSVGRSTEMYTYGDIINTELGYVNLRNAAGNNILKDFNHPVRTSNYFKASYNTDFAGGNFNLFLNLEDVEDELYYISRNNTDSTLEARGSGDDTNIRGLGFIYSMLVNPQLTVSIEGKKERYNSKMGVLPFKPEGSLKLKFNYFRDRNRAYVSFKGFDGHTTDFAGNKTGGYMKCDLGYTRTMNKDFSVSIEADNLFNTKFYKKPGLPEQGRLVSAGIKYRF